MLCPERNKFSDSKLKAENVVKPPRKPTTTKSLAFSEISPEIIKRPASKPIMKHPITLTVNVPSGKELELATRSDIQSDNVYLNTEPANHPIPTKRI